MKQYRIKEYRKIDDSFKFAWLQCKKCEWYSNFEQYGLGLAMPEIMSHFDAKQTDEPIFADNSFFFDTDNNTRCQVYLTENNNVCVVERNEDGMEDVFCVDFGY